ncbi:hypothetical protein AE931_08195 [Xanthomonas arboricola]|nr:hypothetical protein AE931_08195 [Xanthomonas arboricola]
MAQPLVPPNISCSFHMFLPQSLPFVFFFGKPLRTPPLNCMHQGHGSPIWKHYGGRLSVVAPPPPRAGLRPYLHDDSRLDVPGQ